MNQLERVVPSEEEISKEISQDTLIKHISNKPFIPYAEPIKEEKYYAAIYTPGRKPRKRDYKNWRILIARGVSEQDIRERVKIRVEYLGFTYKDKYCNIIALTEEQFLKELQDGEGTIVTLDKGEDNGNIYF